MQPVRLLTLAATGVLLMSLNSCAPGGNEDAVEEAVAVKVTLAVSGNLEQTIRLSGDILADRSVRLFGQIPDRLTEVLVDVGDQVQRGQTLARIRDDVVQAGVEQIEANLRAAQVTLANLQDEYARSQRLHEAGAVSNQTLESVRTQLEATRAQEEQLQAALSAARASLQNAAITAPFSGILAERYLEAGDMAGPGFPVFRLVNMQMVKVSTEISQERLGLVYPGMPARVTVSSYPGQVFVGEIVSIAPVLDPMTRMTRIEIQLENRDGRLKAGMFAEILLIVSAVEAGILVPIDALRDEYRYVISSGQPSSVASGSIDSSIEAEVFVAEADRAVLRLVKVGIVGEEMVEILEGLNVGEAVIIVGKYQVTDGALIIIWNPDPGEEEQELQNGTDR